MKRIASLLLSAALLLALLPACQGPATEPNPPDPLAEGPTALEVVNAVFPSCGFDGPADVEYLTMEEDGKDFLAAYLENAYGLAPGTWEDAAVIRAVGASAFELAVLRLEDGEAAARAVADLTGYISSRQGDFAGYAPAEAVMAANGGTAQDGPYAGLFICPDPDMARAAFEAAIRGGPLPAPTGSVPGLEADADAILDFLLEQCKDEVSALDGLERLNGTSPDTLAAYMEGAYGLSRTQWTQAAIARGTGGSAFELAVLCAIDEDTAWEMAELLGRYLDWREESFDGAPDQAELLYQATAYSIAGGLTGAYVIMPVCEGSEQIVRTLTSVLQPDSIGQVNRRQSSWATQDPGVDPDYSDRAKFVQPNKDDMSLYDTSAICAAWGTGDPSSLSSYDREIYDAAQDILGQVLDSGMSGLEKETAVYHWLVNNVNYDWTHQDVMRETPRESFTPYGGLVNRTAVCLGYATTFQLLMDLAGVECITVVGAAFLSQEDHAWNMVRLDGAWYCVDVTWDANYREQGGRGRQEDWEFFNVTSDSMAGSNHQWDYANTPEAVTQGNGLG